LIDGILKHNRRVLKRFLSERPNKLVSTMALLHAGFQWLRNEGRLIADLKANGEKILVDLTACEIRGNHYTDTELMN
jgi:hypothetical protein